MFHFLKGSIKVAVGEHVKAEQPLGLIGFSGAATTCSQPPHLYPQNSRTSLFFWVRENSILQKLPWIPAISF
jgi:murein DD-endopeptidase MepM/ murein hydrolase activator NlpD